MIIWGATSLKNGLLGLCAYNNCSYQTILFILLTSVVRDSKLCYYYNFTNLCMHGFGFVYVSICMFNFSQSVLDLGLGAPEGKIP